MHPHLHGPRTLALIAAFKFLKSTLLVVLAILLFHLRHPEVSDHLVAWLRALPITTGHEFIGRAIHWWLGMSPQQINLFSAIALVYAGLYAIEGVGLWRNAQWGKYLTVITTSLLIPVEVWEMAVRFTGLKVLALVVNVAIVAYLVHLLRVQRSFDSHRIGPNRSPADSPTA